MHANGVDVFRIFDAMNDIRNLQTVVKPAIKQGAHAQETMYYIVSPVHCLRTWLDMANKLQDMGVHSTCIKDMAGLLKPYQCEELVTRLKESIDLPIAMHFHRKRGLSNATYQEAIDAGIDILYTSISSLRMTYGYTAIETIVSIVEGTNRDTCLAFPALTDFVSYFREVCKTYARFEVSLKGVDAIILIAQVTGGILCNMKAN